MTASANRPDPTQVMGWSRLYQTRADQVRSLVTGMAGSVSADNKTIRVVDGEHAGITETSHSRTIILPHINRGASDEEIANARRLGYIMAQSARQGRKVWQDESDAVTKNIASVLDGGRIRNNICEEYRGDRWLFGAEAYDIAEALAKKQPAEVLTTMLALSGVTSIDAESYGRMAELISQNPEVAELWDKADKAGLVSAAMDIRDDHDSLELAKKLKQFMIDNDIAPESAATGNKGDGESDGGDESKQDGGGGAGATENPEDFLRSHLLSPEQPFADKWDGGTKGAVQELEYQFKDFTVEPAARTCERTIRAIKSKVTSGDKLASELRTLLQVRSQSHYIKNQRRGKLARSQVWKITTPKVGNGDWNTQVFRKKVVADCLDTAVYLMVDCSGSMNGDKYITACAGAALMAECLDTLNINYEVAGFTTTYPGRGEYAYIPIFKRFGNRNVPSNMYAGFGEISSQLHNNPDGPAVMFAKTRLLEQRNKRKLLIVLSDGQPATSTLNDDEALLQAIASTREAGVELYAIGIKSDAPTQYYGLADSVVVKDTSNAQLESTILDVLSRKLI